MPSLSHQHFESQDPDAIGIPLAAGKNNNEAIVGGTCLQSQFSGGRKIVSLRSILGIYKFVKY
jgi:hypothetical protein